MKITELTKHEKKLVSWNLGKTISRHIYDGINAYNHCTNPHKTECQIQIDGPCIYIKLPYLGKSDPAASNYMNDIDADYMNLCSGIAEVCTRYNRLPELVAFGKPKIFRYAKDINISIPIIKAKARFTEADYDCVIKHLVLFKS